MSDRDREQLAGILARVRGSAPAARTGPAAFGAPDIPKVLISASGDQGTGHAPGYEPVGSMSGAPPPTTVRVIQIRPGTNPVRIVDPTRENRIITMLAPLVGFTIYVGNSSVTPSNGYGLVGGLSHDIPIPGLGEIYAVTDAPVVLPLRLQVATLLIGDRERKIEHGT